jgi:hypothetical protein
MKTMFGGRAGCWREFITAAKMTAGGAAIKQIAIIHLAFIVGPIDCGDLNPMTGVNYIIGRFDERRIRRWDGSESA